MKQLIQLVVTIISIGAISCNNQGTREVTTKDSLADTTHAAHPATDTAAARVDTATAANTAATPSGATLHNSRIALDWPGTYTGVLPCADCPGIETTVVLADNNTFVIKTKYIDRGKDVFQDHGKFTWNDAGQIVTLVGTKGTRKFFVGEHTLTQLDSAGNRITGANADKYILKQTIVADGAGTANADLLETHWKLIEVMGKPVKPTPAGEQDIYIVLLKKDNRLAGFAGCNRLIGEWTQKPGNRLSFSKVATTMMACIDPREEEQLKDVIQRVDNYTIQGNTLSLNKARMAPLARFEAIHK
jgi:copper homeostasis protein (lipoprotein)